MIFQDVIADTNSRLLANWVIKLDVFLNYIFPFILHVHHLENQFPHFDGLFCK